MVSYRPKIQVYPKHPKINQPDPFGFKYMQRNALRLLSPYGLRVLIHVEINS